MGRLGAWGFALVGAAIAIGLNWLVEYFVGLNISSFLLFVAIPVGTMGLVFLGLFGYVLGTAYCGHVSDTLDLVFLMFLAFAIPLGIYGYQYLWYLSLVDGPRALGFGAFVNDQIVNTKIHMYARGMPMDAPPVRAGGIGLLASLIKLGALPAIAKVVHSLARSTDPQTEERVRPAYTNWQ